MILAAEKMEEKRIKEHAVATQEIYEEIQRVLTRKLKEEEKQKLKKHKETLNKDFQIELSKMESQFDAKLAKERQETSKTNLKMAQMEITCQTLEAQVDNERQGKENLLQQQNELDLKPVRGSEGQCLRCEALVITNGTAIVKIKKLEKELKIMSRRKQTWSIYLNQY